MRASIALILATVATTACAATTLGPAAGRIAVSSRPEYSGLVASRRLPGVFWTHNDSGDSPRVFAVRADGSPAAPPGSPGRKGVRITGATHVDWEDIAVDDRGHLIIGDLGNNGNARRDLAVYLVPEPGPGDAASAPALKIPFSYPDQTAFPAPDLAFDAEALFWARGHLYLLTKHRRDDRTKLYRFEALDPGRPAPLSLLGSYPTGGPVTAADASPDGRRLAVLTYTGLWLFVAPGDGEDWFQGEASWTPLWAGQAESVCFDGDRILVGNEAGDLFAVDPGVLVRQAR